MISKWVSLRCRSFGIFRLLIKAKLQGRLVCHMVTPAGAACHLCDDRALPWGIVTAEGVKPCQERAIVGAGCISPWPSQCLSVLGVPVALDCE